jgi:hypothetical protein
MPEQRHQSLQRAAGATFTWHRVGRTGYQHAEVAYASTGHRVIGSTAGVGLPVFTGSAVTRQRPAHREQRRSRFSRGAAIP